jgi:alpha-L-rhamnosidase
MNDKSTRRWVVCLTAALTMLSSLPAASAAAVTSPRCEYLADPLGIDVEKPRLSWVIESGKRGERQTAYRVLVASTPELLAKDQGDLWDSGQVASDQSAQVSCAGKPLASRMRCYWKVRAWDRDSQPTPWSPAAFWTMGLLREDDWKGVWIGARSGTPSGQRRPLRDGKREEAGRIDPADAPAVLLRRQVTLDKRPTRATAYICGLGYYELYINGRRAGDHRLDPAFTDYMRRVLYVTYDVSDLVKPGANAVGVMLGNGFYCLQTPDLFQLEKAPWRTPPRMRLNLVVEFDDGSTSTLVSDGQWKCSTGPIQFNCVRGGETIDARKDLGRWLEAGYDDSGWKPALEVAPPLGRLSAQALPPIRITEQFQPRRISEPKPGVYLVDFGRNLAGWVRWTASGRPGQLVTLDYNEALQQDGTLDRNAQTTHTYGRYQHQECILSGATNEVFEPRFTYHAFRYVEFRGLDRAPRPEDLTACRLHTQLRRTSSFECSHPQLNQLHDAARRTLEDCTWSGPTAEPVREKVIWLGDDNFCLDAYFYLFDCGLLYQKQAQDLMDAQEANGHFGPVVPNGGWGEQGKGSVGQLHFCDSPWWSIALAFGVQRLGTVYGDHETLALTCDAVRRYTDFLTSTSRDGILNWGLWDWLPRAGSIETKSEFTSTAAYYYQAKLTADQAARLGRKADAEKYAALAESIKQAFNHRFFNAATGRYALGSQTAQSLPLMLDLAPASDRDRVLHGLVESVRTAGNKLAAGFIGTMPTFYVLTDAGYGDLALEMVKEGWFHMLSNGDGSTLGESPYTRYGGYGSGHHQFGACIAGWLYRCLAGIRPDPAGPGYQKLIIKPALIGDLNWVKAHYDSMHGRVVSHWQREGDQLSMDITIPANTTATVFVPSKDAAAVTESGKPAANAEGVSFLRMENNAAVYAVGSGAYRFQSTLPALPQSQPPAPEPPAQPIAPPAQR